MYDLNDLDAQALTEASKTAIEAEKQCKITLAKDAPIPLVLEWHGGRGHRRTEITVRPGESVVQPRSKAQAWFGPFTVPAEYAQCTDEARKEKLRRFWAEEKARFLNRYDYPRTAYNNMAPTGPHRAPDVTITIIEADGSEHEPIRLHQLYKIGQFDPIADQFAPRESADEVKSRYEAELDSMKRAHEEDRLRLRELAGLVKGLAGSVGSK